MSLEHVCRFTIFTESYVALYTLRVQKAYNSNFMTELVTIRVDTTNFKCLEFDIIFKDRRLTQNVNHEYVTV